MVADPEADIFGAEPGGEPINESLDQRLAMVRDLMDRDPSTWEPKQLEFLEGVFGSENLANMLCWLGEEQQPSPRGSLLARVGQKVVGFAHGVVDGARGIARR